jgi:hypothetical protein
MIKPDSYTTEMIEGIAQLPNDIQLKTLHKLQYKNRHRDDQDEEDYNTNYDYIQRFIDTLEKLV